MYIYICIYMYIYVCVYVCVCVCFCLDYISDAYYLVFFPTLYPGIQLTEGSRMNLQTSPHKNAVRIHPHPDRTILRTLHQGTLPPSID